MSAPTKAESNHENWRESCKSHGGGWPVDLVFVRHGQSEANLAQGLAGQGDTSLWDKGLKDRHTSQYRLTDTGREQAKVTGKWIKENITDKFDRYYVSEYIRTMETAGTMNFEGSEWLLDFYLREQDKGVLAGKSRKEREEVYPDFMELKKKDGFFFCPPGGESTANACLRVNRFLSTIKTTSCGLRVLVVCHGNLLMAFRVRLEGLNQEEYCDIEEAGKADPTLKIHNGQVIHYSRRHPVTGKISQNMRWMRSICPWDLTKSNPEWKEISPKLFQKADLLASVSAVPQLINGGTLAEMKEAGEHLLSPPPSVAELASPLDFKKAENQTKEQVKSPHKHVEDNTSTKQVLGSDVSQSSTKQ